MKRHIKSTVLGIVWTQILCFAIATAQDEFGLFDAAYQVILDEDAKIPYSLNNLANRQPVVIGTLHLPAVPIEMAANDDSQLMISPEQRTKLETALEDYDRKIMAVSRVEWSIHETFGSFAMVDKEKHKSWWQQRTRAMRAKLHDDITSVLSKAQLELVRKRTVVNGMTGGFDQTSGDYEQPELVQWLEELDSESRDKILRSIAEAEYRKDLVINDLLFSAWRAFEEELPYAASERLRRKLGFDLFAAEKQIVVDDVEVAARKETTARISAASVWLKDSSICWSAMLARFAAMKQNPLKLSAKQVDAISGYCTVADERAIAEIRPIASANGKPKKDMTIEEQIEIDRLQRSINLSTLKSALAVMDADQANLLKGQALQIVFAAHPSQLPKLFVPSELRISEEEQKSVIVEFENIRERLQHDVDEVLWKEFESIIVEFPEQLRNRADQRLFRGVQSF